jgi:hypothetical protein
MEILLSGVNLSSQALTEDYDETSKPISKEELGNAPTYGRKKARWVFWGDEIYVRDNEDIEGLKDYTVEHRSGRFGSETLYAGEPDEFDDGVEYAEFDEFENALEHAESIIEGKLKLSDLLQ